MAAPPDVEVAAGTPPAVARLVLWATVVVIAVAATGVVPTVVSLVIAAVVVVVVGVPHGAIDHLVVEHISDAPIPRVAFVVRYLSAMAGVGGIWLVAPKVALVAFLAMSVYHFGQSDLARLGIARRAPRLALYWTRGLLLVALPLVAHLDEVAPTIALLVDIDPSTWSVGSRRWWIAAGIGLTHVVALVATLGRDRRLPGEIVSAVALGVLFVVADPLLGFAVYFGLWHSLGHLYVLADRLDAGVRPLRHVARLAAPLAAVSVAGLVALSAALALSGAPEWIVPASIIAVSMLTAPHMVVVEHMWRVEVISRRVRGEPARTPG